MKIATPISNAKFDLFLRLKKYVSMELAYALSQCLDFVRIEKILKDTKDLMQLNYWKKRILDFIQPSCN